jgi:hypothetical protein
MNKTYIVTKLVTAKNITQAIKKEKESEIDSIETFQPKTRTEQKKPAIGFRVDTPEEDNFDEDDYE